MIILLLPPFDSDKLTLHLSLYKSITKISNQNHSMVRTLADQKRLLINDNEQKLESLRHRYSGAIATLKNRHQAAMQKKDHEVKIARGEAREYIDLAYELTDEVAESKSAYEIAMQKEHSAVAQSTQRLSKLRQTQDSVLQLREALDDTREDLEARLSAALNENTSLKKKLAQQSDVVHDLQTELMQAQEEMAVSYVLLQLVVKQCPNQFPFHLSQETNTALSSEEWQVLGLYYHPTRHRNASTQNSTYVCCTQYIISS